MPCCPGYGGDELDARTERFAEFVDLLDELLRGHEVTYAGRFWSAEAVRLMPGCVQEPRVPFAVAASVPRSIEIAARHGSIWVTNGDRSHRGPPLEPARGANVVSQQLERLFEVCESQGRDPATIDGWF